MLTPFAWPEMFADHECDEIIRMANAKGFRDAGEQDWILDRVIGTVASANRQHFGFKLDDFAEQLQVALYDVDDGDHFDWHVDIGSGPVASKRKLTLVAQLSDRESYVGGELAINSTGVSETASGVGTKSLASPDVAGLSLAASQNSPIQ